MKKISPADTLFLLTAILLTALTISILYADDAPAVRVLTDNAIEVNGERIILSGIAIPTATVMCEAEEKQWPCGASATLRLSSILKSALLSCVRLEESAALPLARCANSQFDIAGQLVMEGWAITVADDSEYATQERYAEQRQLGLWRDGYSPPQHWRRYPDSEFDFVKDLQCSICAVRRQ
ncbi:MAG: hypothetical protein OXI60_09810 [Acidiferrobacterales bacterium]|nr:hypothetical protein [Acidiferrobacterales bacterium]